MNTVIPDARYTHRDSSGNVCYNMSDESYREWSSASGRSCRHEDIRDTDYRPVYNDYN